MTISDEELNTYQTRVSEFSRQSEENTCLPTALVNILDELATRHDMPGIRITQDEMEDHVDYDPLLGSVAENLPEKLNPVLQSYSYEIIQDRSLTMDDLEDILEDEGSSYPVVEFDSRYFDWVDGYDLEGGMHGRAQPHTVVPFSFNDETVLIFDPYEDFYSFSTDTSTPPKEVPQPLFYEWWSGESIPRWTLWVDQIEQQTLETTTEEQ